MAAVYREPSTRMISKRHPNGITLIESLFGVALVVLISGAIWAFNRDFGTLNRLIQYSLIGQHEASRTLKVFAAETRTASISNLGAYPLVNVDPASFTFYSDTNGDGLKERIRYYLDGSEVKKGVIVPTGNPLVYNSAAEMVTTVIRDVSNSGAPVFSYYDSAYDGTTNPLAMPVNVLDVRLVKVTVVIDKNGTNAPIPATYTTQISFRNLKDNT